MNLSLMAIVIVTMTIVNLRTTLSQPMPPPANQCGKPCEHGLCRSDVFRNGSENSSHCYCHVGWAGQYCGDAAWYHPSRMRDQVPELLIMLFLGSLRNMTFNTNSDVPLLLKITKDLTTDVVPCLMACALDNVPEMYDAIVHQNGTIGDCLWDARQRLNKEHLDQKYPNYENLPMENLFEFVSNPSRICPIITGALECMLAASRRLCGPLFIREAFTDVLSLLDCVPNKRNLNIVKCVLPLIINNTFADQMLDCLIRKDFYTFFNITSLDQWIVLHDFERVRGFSRICSAFEGAQLCFTDTMVKLKGLYPDGSCEYFQDFVIKNVQSIMEQMNCFNNGTDTFLCIGNEALHTDVDRVRSIASHSQLNRTINPNIPNILPPIFDFCGPALPNITRFNALHYDVSSKASAHKTTIRVASTLCSMTQNGVGCLDNAHGGLAAYTGCALPWDGVLSMVAPLRYKIHQLMPTGCSPYNNAYDEQHAMVTTGCGCIVNKSLPICNEELHDYVMSVVIVEAWNDSNIDKSCNQIGKVGAICKAIEAKIRDTDVYLNYIGISPNEDENVESVAVFYSAQFPMSLLKTVTVAVKQLFAHGVLHNVQVLPQVDIRNLEDKNVSISWVTPLIGPVAGGTTVTVTGMWLAGIEDIYIGDRTMVCHIIQRSSVVVLCDTPQLVSGNALALPLSISYMTSDADLHTTEHLFNYKPNPVITSVEPLKTIFVGGVKLTVSGSNFHIVRTRIMVTTVTSLITGRTATYETTCTTESPERMLCPTPPINEKDLARRRRSIPVNALHNFTIEIAFILDNVPDFRNLSGGELKKFSQIDVYANPETISFEPDTLVFTSTWPVSEKTITIKGERLLEGIKKSEYSVKVGVSECKIEVYSNNIIVTPPTKRPHVKLEEYTAFNIIPVHVLYATQVNRVGSLAYVQNIWEYKPGRYMIVGTVLALLLIIACTTSICCICKRRPPTHDEIEEETPQQEQRNMVVRVKRWSRKQQKRFGTFIPTGTRMAASGPPGQQFEHAF